MSRSTILGAAAALLLGLGSGQASANATANSNPCYEVGASGEVGYLRLAIRSKFPLLTAGELATGYGVTNSYLAAGFYTASGDGAVPTVVVDGAIVVGPYNQSRMALHVYPAGTTSGFELVCYTPSGSPWPATWSCQPHTPSPQSPVTLTLVASLTQSKCRVGPF